MHNIIFNSALLSETIRIKILLKIKRCSWTVQYNDEKRIKEKITLNYYLSNLIYFIDISIYKNIFNNNK